MSPPIQMNSGSLGTWQVLCGTTKKICFHSDAETKPFKDLALGSFYWTVILTLDKVLLRLHEAVCFFLLSYQNKILQKNICLEGIKSFIQH